MNVSGSKSCLICLTKTRCSQFGGCHTGLTRPLRSSLFSIMGRSVRQSALSKASNKVMVWGRSCSRSRCRDYIGSLLAMPVSRCVAVADDLNLVGPAADVLRALMTSLWTLRTLALHLRASKCGVLCPIARNSLLISEPLPKLALYEYSRDIWLL